MTGEEFRLALELSEALDAVLAGQPEQVKRAACLGSLCKLLGLQFESMKNAFDARLVVRDKKIAVEVKAALGKRGRRVPPH